MTTQYITQLYRQWLGREPDATGLNHFVQQIERGYLTKAQAAASLYASAEFTQGAFQPLVLLYNAAFGRLPDEIGLRFWRGVYEEGGSWAQIADQFVQSPEFLGRYGGQVSDADFVELVYQNVLARPSDTGGRGYWISKLHSGMTRGDILQGFAQSPENVQKYATVVQTAAAYWGIQGRLPNAAEITAAPADQMVLFSQLSSTVGVPPTLGASISFSTRVINESFHDDGSMGNAVEVLLTGDAFAKVGSVVPLKPAGLPAGLNAVLHILEPQRAVLEIAGAASSHKAAIKNIQLPLTADLLQSGNPAALSGLKQNLTLKFADVFAHEQYGTLHFSGTANGVINIQLPQSTLKVGTQTVDLYTGRLQDVMAVDLSGVTPGKGGVVFVGDADANIFLGNDAASTVRGAGGNDILQAGTGSNRFVFEQSAADNGRDIIHGFKYGKGGDVLDFSAFLNRTGTSKIGTLLSSQSTERAVNNGDVFVIAGAVHDEAQVAALFGAGLPLANPTQAGKYVVITADITGDATVWGIVNQTDINSIQASEIAPLATLVGVHNFQLVGLAGNNLA